MYCAPSGSDVLSHSLALNQNPGLLLTRETGYDPTAISLGAGEHLNRISSAAAAPGSRPEAVGGGSAMRKEDRAIPLLQYQAISRGKREWEQTFDAVPDLIFITDTHYTISRANRAMARRCGLRPEELPGRKCYQLFHNLDSPPPFCPCLKMMRDGLEQAAEIEEEKLGGFFDISVSPLYDDVGALVACVHVARDVTERKKAEEYRLTLEQQLLQTQKLESLGVLTGGIAHDFNNILMIMLGHCQLAQEDGDPASVRTHLLQIEQAGNRAADLCRQMLAYAGKTPLLQTRIDLHPLVEDMVQMLQPAFRKNVSFRYHRSPDLPEINGDQGKIQQVVMNLLVNAGEAIGQEQGAVTVSLARDTVAPGECRLDFFGAEIAPGAYACLEVSDSGCGMDQETQKRIFEPFFSTKFTGRGLGLSAMVGIVRSHKGALQLSSSPGAGTTFRICIPLAPPADGAGGTRAAVEQKPAARPAEKTLQGTVLLVDDEDELRRLGSYLLGAMGLTVITACNGREALQIYSERGTSIDLVLTDLTMPEMDGIETYHELRKLAPLLPILFCSGYGNQNISASIAGDARAAFMPKPYHPEQLRQKLACLWNVPPDAAG